MDQTTLERSPVMAQSTIRPTRSRYAGQLFPVALAALLVWTAACSSSSSTTTAAGSAPAPNMSTTPPSPDPRVGLRAGRTNAGEASWNMRLLDHQPSPPMAVGAFNSDLAFSGNFAIQGNYNGYVVWDISRPNRPSLAKTFQCPASQDDVSVYKNLLFVSSESTSGRLDCGTVPDSAQVSEHRMRGIRVFDVTDIRNPRYIGNVQTCRGSHTHTLVTDPNDPNNVYIYVSGSAAVRPAAELAGCSDLTPEEDPNSSRFRIEVIQVPVANPQNARIVNGARIFEGLTAAPQRSQTAPAGGGGGGGGRGGAAGGGGGGGRAAAAGAPAAASSRTGPEQCHDITVYPGAGLGGGACRGYGILLDIRNPAQPRRLAAVADTNFATWHSVTFNNDGNKVLWTDEWGGGTAPRCRAEDSKVWGGDAVYDIVGGNRPEFRGYYKMPAAQTEQENCVAHNGSLIPIPGRDVKVQGWYQGGVSIFDWTDSRNPVEIAYFDRGPLVADTLRTAGSWSAYWYNGYIYSSEIDRGFDTFELMPSGWISQNEIDAARSVRLAYFNAQEQQKFVWPATFSLSRAYLDQLQRSRGLAPERITAIRTELARAEGLNGAQRTTALTQLATQIDADVSRSPDQAKTRLLATSVRNLAGAR
jgi:hypothetical protein